MPGIALVTGATGYVGGRLVNELLIAGWQVRILARSPEKLRGTAWADNVTVIEGDITNEADVRAAMRGASVAYFLVHALQHGQQFDQTETGMAKVFAAAAQQESISRIIYLGGLAPDIAVDQMSVHMRGRVNVGAELAASGIPTAEFRASIIIGSGSASFEMLRYLTERLPIMVTPRWVRTPSQPIAIRDVLGYLVKAAGTPEPLNGIFEIGGPDVLTYEQMMQRYAAVAGLKKRIIMPINVLTPELSGHWVNVVTPVPRAIARPLVQSLRHPAVCTEHRIAEWIPDPPAGLTPFDEAVSLALTKVRNADVQTRWSDAAFPGTASEPMPSDPHWSGGTMYQDVREVPCDADAQALWGAVARIGGDTGWYAAQFLWRVRGIFDRLIGGVGLRRGRRDPNTLSVGEALDFWRVEECLAPQVLRLRAEMRMPGRAWLEFVITAESDRSVLHQRAVFLPTGLAGHAYWWAVAPFHAFVFPPMARRIVQYAEQSQAHQRHSLGH